MLGNAEILLMVTEGVQAGMEAYDHLGLSEELVAATDVAADLACSKLDCPMRHRWPEEHR